MKKKGIVFPLIAYKDPKHPFASERFIFPFWQIIINELKKYYDLKVFDGKTIHNQNISLKYKEELRTLNGKKWTNLLKNEDYDFIIQHHVEPYIETKKPVFIITDSVSAHSFRKELKNIPENKQLIVTNHEKEYYKKAKHIFVTSPITRDVIIDNYKINKNEVSLIYPPIISKIANIKKDYTKQNIVFAGIPFDMKGGNELLKAFRKINKKYPNAKLDIISITNKKMPKNVTNHGYINLKNKNKFYDLIKKATLLVLPMKRTNMPIVLLEAMATKTPIITTNVFGPNKEMIEKNGKCGVVVELHNLENNLYNAIDEMFANPEQMQKYAQNGFDKYIKHYDYRKYIKLIRSTIANNINII